MLMLPPLVENMVCLKYLMERAKIYLIMLYAVSKAFTKEQITKSSSIRSPTKVLIFRLFIVSIDSI